MSDNKALGFLVGVVILFIAFGFAVYIQDSTALAVESKDILSTAAIILGFISIAIGAIEGLSAQIISVILLVGMMVVVALL